MPDKDAALKMAKSMLEVFYSNVNLNGFEVVDVERPCPHLSTQWMEALQITG